MIDGQRVALHDFKSSGIMRRDLRKCGQAPRVAFDGHNAPRASCQERPCQATRPGTDLKHVAGVERACRTGDFGRQIEIEQKILPQPFLRAQLVARDYVAKRR